MAGNSVAFAAGGDGNPARVALSTRQRTTREVLEDHLRLRADGDLEEDLRRNVSPEIAVLTCSGVWRGHDGVREQADALGRLANGDEFDYGELVVEGEVGYLEWCAHDGEGCLVRDGADSYVVRDGMIVAQTIHYTDAKR